MNDTIKKTADENLADFLRAHPGPTEMQTLKKSGREDFLVASITSHAFARALPSKGADVSDKLLLGIAGLSESDTRDLRDLAVRLAADAHHQVRTSLAIALRAVAPNEMTPRK